MPYPWSWYSVQWGLLHSLGIAAKPYTGAFYSILVSCQRFLWGRLKSVVFSAVPSKGSSYSDIWGPLQPLVGPAAGSCMACYTACTTGYLVLRRHLQRPVLSAKVSYRACYTAWVSLLYHIKKPAAASCGADYRFLCELLHSWVSLLYPPQWPATASCEAGYSHPLCLLQSL